MARFNDFVTRQLLTGALETLARHGVRDDDVGVAWVPGSFELPVVAKTLAQTGRYDSVICLGAVIRGETDHYEMVAGQSAGGIASVGLDTGVPTIFGVLTADNMDQAINRRRRQIGKHWQQCGHCGRRDSPADSIHQDRLALKGVGAWNSGLRFLTTGASKT